MKKYEGTLKKDASMKEAGDGSSLIEKVVQKGKDKINELTEIIDQLKRRELVL